jgi:arylsulfatase A-like enzyme
MRWLATFALLAGCEPGPVAPGDPVVPDVVLVSIDTLRADHLGCYGYTRPTSPFIDSLAARGLRWAHARSPSPWTLPSHATMLSGLLPHHHLAVEDDLGLPPELPLLAESMAARGFATGGFTSTLFVSRKYGFERGFEHFDDGGIETSRQNLAGAVTATDVVDEALAWLRQREPGEPVFLFLHFYDTHYAYDPPAPFDTMFDRAPSRDDPTYKKYHYYLDHPLQPDQLAHQVAQYDEAIRYVDSELERLQEALAVGGRAATWVITADHGEELGERGSWGHAHTLYPEQLQVPLIIAGARVTEAAVMQPVAGLEDLPATIAALTGAQHPAGDGQILSLTPGANPVAARSFLAETSRFSTRRASLWRDGWRLDLDATSGQRALFDTRADPQERTDLAAAQPARVQQLEGQLWRELGTPWECREAGAVRARQGLLIQGGTLAERGADLAVGERFQVFPVDSELQHASAPERYRAGERLPAPDAPLAWHGPGSGAVQLSPEQRAQLEALGYIQGEQGE